MLGSAETLRVDLVHVLGAGRARREPGVLGDDLDPADRRSVPGSMGQRGDHRLAREHGRVQVSRGQGCQDLLLRGGGRRIHPAVCGCAVPVGECRVVLTGVLPGHSRDLGGEQAGDQTVLVGGPDPAVAAQERRARALLPAESEGGVDQPVHEPLETDRNLDDLTSEPGGDPVNHARTDQGLADRGSAGPAVAMREQIGDRG